MHDRNNIMCVVNKLFLHSLRIHCGSENIGDIVINGNAKIIDFDFIDIFGFEAVVYTIDKVR